MNYKITEAFRMTKRRLGSNDEKTVSKSHKIGEKSTTDAYNLRLQCNNQPNADFPTTTRTSNRFANKLSPQTKPGTSVSRNKAVRSSPRTPRRSPRINNGSARISKATQETPCSQEQEITWKWDSPGHERSLRSNKRNVETESISDIVQKFVPSLCSQSSLYDLWRGPSDTTSPNVPIVRRAPITKPKQKVFLEKQLNQLIEQLNGGQESNSTKVTMTSKLQDERESSKIEVQTCNINQRCDWDDDDLFDDDSFITRTQEIESNAVKKESSQNAVETTQGCTVNSKVDANDVTERKSDKLDANWGDDDWIFEMVPNAVENDSHKEDKNDDSLSDLFNCPTQPRLQSVEEKAFEEELFGETALACEEVMEMAVLDTSTDDMFPKDAFMAERVGSLSVNVQQNGDSSRSVRNGSIPETVRNNSTESTLIMAPSTSNAVAEVTCCREYTLEEIERKKQEALQRRCLRLANNAQPPVEIPSSSQTVLSQQCSPEEIEKKKQAALRRRSLRLANLREIASASKSNTDKRENGSFHKCTEEEISRKRQEAIKRRQQKRQMER